MRVTNRMLSNNFLSDMRTNLNNMKTLQSQLSSGKEIRRPSDDPFKVARAMQLNTDISANKQYNENISDTINWLDATDTSLDQVTQTFQRIRELTISSGNAAYGSDERRAIKDELNQKVSEIAQILNSNFDGKYVFGGSKVTSKPLGVKDFDASGNKGLFFAGKEGEELSVNSTDITMSSQMDMIKGKLPVEVSQGVTMDYNVSAYDVLNFTSEKGKQINVSNLLNNIITNLDSSSADAQSRLTGENLDDLTAAASNILKIRAEVGAKQNRMDSAKDKNDQENYNLTEVLSNTEDIDITQKTMEYSTMQTVYMASLQTSAKIIQPSLMDYLR
ncbi:flagellar hook-associated protein FlgL [Clostridium manihotivorum]|uniref:Flagellar hook-associated protein 3 n=1 Tax=Clostridium manihotivorum TaxID=2320868 RepID=A0A410DRH9_9CLOT|nr:flagellar hook-associated protein FlgL [Clostridium manihotivorum]QAA31641.1 flagellar hook-associated protein 3 [Clostridium manihotivorum]